MENGKRQAEDILKLYGSVEVASAAKMKGAGKMQVLQEMEEIGRTAIPIRKQVEAFNREHQTRMPDGKMDLLFWEGPLFNQPTKIKEEFDAMMAEPMEYSYIKLKASLFDEAVLGALDPLFLTLLTDLEETRVEAEKPVDDLLKLWSSCWSANNSAMKGLAKLPLLQNLRSLGEKAVDLEKTIREFERNNREQLDTGGAGMKFYEGANFNKPTPLKEKYDALFEVPVMFEYVPMKRALFDDIELGAVDPIFRMLLTD